VTVVGRPNAGKSTLLNRVVGEKLAITSEKPQSTRDRVVGIRTEGGVQMVFFDTPGLLEPRYALHEAMRAAAVNAVRDADVVIYWRTRLRACRSLSRRRPDCRRSRACRSSSRSTRRTC
jgi:GTP-binding protein Era